MAPYIPTKEELIHYTRVIETLKPISKADEDKVHNRFMAYSQRQRHNGALRLADAINQALQIEDFKERLNALEGCLKTLIEVRQKLNQTKQLKQIDK